ncbi:hypothetical protein ABZ345_20995 [Lentzea sp. NPDC005914]|uniref:hypothetical protein n=1 Tax=Lentzea sp. NPDC005914 TaxID=3154572 RepID=UPI0033DEA97A
MIRYLWPVVVLAACSAPQPPQFTDADACALLQSGDAGNLSGMPTKSSATCDYTFDSLTARLTLRTEKYADAAASLGPDSYGAVVETHPMTRRCTDASGVVTCDAVVEVRDGQLVGLKVVQRNHDVNLVGQVTQGLAARALERLPK